MVVSATAARFNMLRMFTLRVREPAPQFGIVVLQHGIVATATATRFNLLCKLACTATWYYCFTVSGCGSGPRCAV